MTTPRDRGARPRVLIIVQNLPVPFDRRVWLECKALTAAGYDVTVVCPKGKNDPEPSDPRRRHSPEVPPLRARWRARRLRHGIRLLVPRDGQTGLPRSPSGDRSMSLQACNPPDIFWPIARWLRRRDGSRFVFDHHDLCPELLRLTLSRRGSSCHAEDWWRWSGRPSGPPTTSCPPTPPMPRSRCAGATSGRRMSPSCAPDPIPSACAAGKPVPALRRGREHLVAYIGVMGPQDGVDLAIRAAAYVVHDLGREDVSFTFMGAGDCYDEIVALRDDSRTAGLRGAAGPGPRRNRHRRAVDRRCGTVPRPEESAQRCLDDEQDPGIHGLRNARRRVRPQGNPGVGQRGRVLCNERRRGGVRPSALSRFSTTPRSARTWAGKGACASRRSSAGRTSATPMSASTTGSSGAPARRRSATRPPVRG